MKYTIASVSKAAAKGYDGTFVLSEESVDRDGDTISIDGWDLSNFTRNAPALWGHDPDKLIGQWENLRIKGKQLIGDLRLASTNLAQMARQLIDENILKAVSVGFIPHEYEPNEKGGYHVSRAELLEVSLVSVPAHPNALRLAKSFGLTVEDRGTVFATPAKRVAPDAGSGIDPAIEKAQRHRAEIKQFLERYHA